MIMTTILENDLGDESSLMMMMMMMIQGVPKKMSDSAFLVIAASAA